MKYNKVKSGKIKLRVILLFGSSIIAKKMVAIIKRINTPVSNLDFILSAVVLSKYRIKFTYYRWKVYLIDKIRQFRFNLNKIV